MRGRRIATEAWILIGLFALFLAFVAYFERIGQERTAAVTPSSYNAKAQGVKALYLLFAQTGYPTARLTTTWDGLDSSDKLLVAVEPFERPVDRGEIGPLRRWVMSGGTVLYFVTSPPRPLDPSDTVAGDVAIIAGKAEQSVVKPDSADSPYLRNVSAFAVKSAVRLQPAPHAPYTILFHDEQGALALHKPLGKGHVLVVANSAATSNSFIREADNAVFLVNIAAASLGAQGGNIVFDEYHHGVGFEGSVESGDSTWEYMPKSVRLALWQALGLLALLVYNGNRRFGRPRTLPMPTYRPSTDYVGSMARLYRRAGAGDIALVTLYKIFVRELAHILDVSPDLPALELAQRAAQKYNIEDAALLSLVTRCEEVLHGKRVSEAEMLDLAQRLERFRRRFDLVRE